MTKSSVIKRIENLESLAAVFHQQVLEEATNLKRELELISTPAPRKGLSKEVLAGIRAKQGRTIQKRQYE